MIELSIKQTTTQIESPTTSAIREKQVDCSRTERVHTTERYHSFIYSFRLFL